MLSKIERNPWIIRSLQVTTLTLCLIAWEVSALGERTFQFFFSRPTLISLRLWAWISNDEIHRHMFRTLAETVIGYGMGVIGGLVLALLCYYIPLFYSVIRPFMDIANGMPRAVFGPLFMLWFGLGMTSKAVLAASLVIFIVFFATLAGLHEVDKNIIHKVRLMGGGRWDVLFHVLLPSALSWVFSSLRASVGFALAGAVVGEYIGSSRGLGFLIALSEGNLDSTGIFTGLLILAIMVLILNAILERIERWLTPWRLT